MERAGAQAVILAGFHKADNWYTIDQEVEKKHAQDEAIGYTVHIPAFMLNKENGDVVKKFAEKSMG